MRNPVFAFRSATACKVLTVAVLAATAASCSSSRFHSGLFTGSTANQREIIGSTDQPMPAPVANASVSRVALPPPATTYVAANEQPAALPSDSLGDTYAWSAVGGQVITVAPGDTLASLTARYGVPPMQLLNANQLSSANQIVPGRILVIPHRVTRMAEAAPSAPAAPPARIAPAPAITAGTGTYVVRSGDTLYSIARRSGANVNDLVALNGLTSADQIRIGQALKLPAGASSAALAYAPAKPKPTRIASAEPMIKLKSPAETAATGSPVADSGKLKAPPVPAMPQETTAVPTTAVAAAAIAETADPASADGTSFRWPVRGRIISGFGSKPNGERNDGINLAVPEGTSVKAAEAGTVIYAGNELEGYGNLILIRHADGWVSAYAHNEDLLVKRGDNVKRGQVIAHAGMSGSVTSPQVHFELRKGAKPVNPLNYLTS